MWCVCIAHTTFFYSHCPPPLFFCFILPVLVWYMGWGFCLRVWCAITGIIKLSINDFCSQTNTCVTQRAAVSDVVHISYVLPPYESVLTYSLGKITYRLRLYTSSTFPPHMLGCIYKSIYTVNMYITDSHHLIYQSFYLLVVLWVLSPVSLQHSDSHTINMPYAIDKHARKHAQACTHKVAWLVGAMATALLCIPRVAPGARLPVVCQRLRVEFIQIKAVEWGPSPRMPRPSPSSAFRRWE